MPKSRVTFKLHHYVARKRLHNNAFESQKSALVVVLQHPDPCPSSEVEVRETVLTRI